MAALQRPAIPLPHRLARPLGRLPMHRAVVALVLALVVAVALLQVNQFSRAASTGYQINDLNAERSAKQAENHAIEAEVARLSSLARVDIEARLRLGMVPAERKLSIAVNQPAPARESLPTRFLPQTKPVTPATATNEPFWKRLLRLLPFF